MVSGGHSHPLAKREFSACASNLCLQAFAQIAIYLCNDPARPRASRASPPNSQFAWSSCTCLSDSVEIHTDLKSSCAFPFFDSDAYSNLSSLPTSKMWVWQFAICKDTCLHRNVQKWVWGWTPGLEGCMQTTSKKSNEVSIKI